MKIIRDRTVSFSGHRKLGLSSQIGLFSRYPIVGDSSGFIDTGKLSDRRIEVERQREGVGDAEDRAGQGCDWAGVKNEYKGSEESAEDRAGQGCDWAGQRREIEQTNSSDRLRNQLVCRVEQEVVELCKQGYNTFMSGMAQGFDLLAAEAVLSVKRSIPTIKLIAVVPFSGQSRDFDVATKRLYDHILANATETITLSRYYSPDCFHLRNDFLVDNSSALICLFNGTKGGTAYTVKRAIKRGLKVINVDQ